MIALLAGWIKWPSWAIELLLIAIAVCAVWFWHHSAIDKGIAEQKAADVIELNKLKADNDLKSAALQARATSAEQAYDKEHLANLEFQSSHLTGPVRLCLTTNKGNSAVPKAGTPQSGNETAGAPSGNVLKVPEGNSGSGEGRAGPDISGLLSILAKRADDVSAVLREYQARDN